MEDSIDFSNNNIETSTLPQIQQLTFIPLSPKYRQTNFVINLCVLILFCTAFMVIKFQTFFDISQEPEKVLLIVLFTLSTLVFINLLFQLLADTKKAYALREQDLSYTSGLIFKKTVTQPILRIQHVELKRGPIERKVGLAKIQVFSAGGSLHTFEIPGLMLETAESIRQFILDHKDVNHDG